MNVLIFTTTILMILAMITYARLEMFTSFTALQSQFETYMAHTVEVYNNAQAKKLYNNIAVSKKDEDKVKKRKASEGSSKLSVRILTQRLAQRRVDQVAETTALLRNLMNVLYRGQPFYDSMLEKRPDFIQEIVNQIQSEVDLLPEGQTIQDPKSLATFNLKDEELQEVFIKMLRGNERLKDPSEKRAYKADKGEYFSLLDYLTMSTKTKLRVYLAPYSLLVAIFGTDAAAKEVITERERIYQNLKDEKITAEEATQELRELFSSRRSPNIAESLLDFTVTTTNPKDYRTP